MIRCVGLIKAAQNSSKASLLVKVTPVFPYFNYFSTFFRNHIAANKNS